MKKFIGSITVLSVIGMVRLGCLYGVNSDTDPSVVAESVGQDDAVESADGNAVVPASDAEPAAESAAEVGAEPAAESATEPAVEPAGGQTEVPIAAESTIEKKKKSEKKKITYFDTASNSIEKVIPVNSVNFIKLKRKAGQIFVPNPKVADIDVIDDTSLYLTGLKPGVTSVVVQDKNGKLVANYSVRVTYPIDEIKKTVKMLFPDSVLELISMDESLIMRGKVPSPEDASEIQSIVEKFVDKKNIINKMEVITATQVLLKVKIAEITRSVDQSLGLNWRALSFGKSGNGPNSGFWVGKPSGLQVDLNKDGAKKVLMDSSIGGNFSGKWFLQTGASNNISAVLDALATERFASIVAEPTLVAISGQKATFTSGGEQGYKTKQSGSGDDNYTTDFKEWGTMLEFTPVVLAENRIKITVKPKISALEPTEKDQAPSLTTKEAETTVELGSGQSLAIAGLLQTNKNATTNRVPFLADVPIIGSLFRNSEVKNNERELVIIVTPYIVKPSSKGLKTPTDAMTKMYSSIDVVLKGKSHAVAGGAEGTLSIK